MDLEWAGTALHKPIPTYWLRRSLAALRRFLPESGAARHVATAFDPLSKVFVE